MRPIMFADPDSGLRAKSRRLLLPLLHCLPMIDSNRIIILLPSKSSISSQYMSSVHSWFAFIFNRQ